MVYIFEYEIFTLICVIAVFINFKTNRFFPTIRNRFFGYLTAITICFLVFDIIAAVLLVNPDMLPPIFTYMAIAAYLSTQIFLSAMCFFYCVALCGKYIKMSTFVKAVLSMPSVISIFLILVLNPVNNLIFYFEKTGIYRHGICFHLLSVVTAFYLGSCIFMILKQYKETKNKHMIMGLLLIFGVILSTVVQIFFPKFLITGAVTGMAVATLYFTVQNPRNMLDYRTKALNHNSYLQYMNEVIHEKIALNIILLQIENITYINRKFGIKSGMALFSKAVDFISDQSDDVWVYRTIGARFVLITKNIKSYHTLTERIAQNIDKPWDISGIEILPQIIVRCIENLDVTQFEFEDMINFLEIAQSENAGLFANNVCDKIDSDGIDNLKKILSIENELLESLETGEGFFMCFQPIHCAKSNSAKGLEALVRYERSNGEVLLPGKFLSIIEKNGLMQKLDYIVIQKVVDFIDSYSVFDNPDIEFVSINLSLASFASNDFPEYTSAFLTACVKNPDKIVFEVSETVMSAFNENLLSCMQKYIKKGYRFSLDDFGMGYSNFSKLVQMPFSIIKVDKSLINDSTLILDDIIHLMKSLNKVTLIEGIETKIHYEKAIKLEADYIQGFYLSLPVAQERILEHLGTQKSTLSRKQ